MINPQGDRTSYVYDNAGRRTLKRLANGTRALFAYDPAGNLTTTERITFTYDGVKRRDSVTTKNHV